MELKLLCSYKEWKDNKSPFNEMLENTAKLLNLSMKFNRSEEEEQEYQELQKQSDIESACKRYTILTHVITDMYEKLKYTHDDDDRQCMYTRIGKKQCEIEIIKEETSKNRCV